MHLKQDLREKQVANELQLECTGMHWTLNGTEFSGGEVENAQLSIHEAAVHLTLIPRRAQRISNDSKLSIVIFSRVLGHAVQVPVAQSSWEVLDVPQEELKDEFNLLLSKGIGGACTVCIQLEPSRAESLQAIISMGWSVGLRVYFYSTAVANPSITAFPGI